jgi:hypothetical protein
MNVVFETRMENGHLSEGPVMESDIENGKFKWTNAEFGTHKRLCHKGKVLFMDCHWTTKRNGWEA